MVLVLQVPQFLNTTNAAWYWRRVSFRYQLLKAKKEETNGFLVQIAEFDWREGKQEVLGNGEQIETEMAEPMGVNKVFQEVYINSGGGHCRMKSSSLVTGRSTRQQNLSFHIII